MQKTLESRVKDLRCRRVWVFGVYRVWGSGFRDQGSRFRALG